MQSYISKHIQMLNVGATILQWYIKCEITKIKENQRCTIIAIRQEDYMHSVNSSFYEQNKNEVCKLDALIDVLSTSATESIQNITRQKKCIWCQMKFSTLCNEDNTKCQCTAKNIAFCNKADANRLKKNGSNKNIHRKNEYEK